jgi:CreA protein
MNPGRAIMAMVILGLALTITAEAEEIGCVSTTWRVWADDKICVSAFDDPKVPGVTCYLSQARTGGFKGTIGVAEDRSRFSIACRQVGPITVELAKLPDEEEAFSERTSLLFKETRVVRLVDRARRTLVYLAYSTKVVEGSPFNSLSSVPVMAWQGQSSMGAEGAQPLGDRQP